MTNSEKYIYTSQRLGFRNWKSSDLDEYAAMNADSEVMKHFPSTYTREKSAEGIEVYQRHLADKGYTYYATELLESGEFIGFIGMYYQEFKSDFTPATDIGWRLKQSVWGKGYATEGAKRCLDYAFKDLQLDHLISTCTVQNEKSENVMRKIGMERMGTFLHPRLEAYPEHERCVWYKIS